MKEALKKIIQEFQEAERPHLVRRDRPVDLSVPKTLSLVGPRRSGKTYFFFQLIGDLIAKGIAKEQIIYLDLEDPRLYPFSWKDIDQVLDAHSELFPELKGDRYVFLDEVQEVQGWERAVRALGDRPKCRVFITGSSSKVLNTDIATSLRGRTISYDVLPFSFMEFLNAKGLTVDQRTQYSVKRHAVMKALDEYIEFGGYPEVVLTKDKDTKVRILREYFNTMIIRDLIERYHIRNTVLLKEMAIFLITNLSHQFSISKYHRSIKEQHDVSKKTVQSFLSHFEDVRLVFPIKLYSHSIRVQQANPVKVYSTDVGLITAIGFYTSEDRGRIIENIVLLELMHRKLSDPRLELFYWKKDNCELDFVVKSGKDVQQLVQVSWSIKDANTKKRELEGLSKAMEAFGIKKGLLITHDEEGLEKLDGGRTVTIVPLWKWSIAGL